MIHFHPFLVSLSASSGPQRQKTSSGSIQNRTVLPCPTRHSLGSFTVWSTRLWSIDLPKVEHRRTFLHKCHEYCSMQHACMALNGMKWDEFNDLDQFEVEQPWVTHGFWGPKALQSRLMHSASNHQIITSSHPPSRHFITMGPWKESILDESWILPHADVHTVWLYYFYALYRSILYRLHRLYMTTYMWTFDFCWSFFFRLRTLRLRLLLRLLGLGTGRTGAQGLAAFAASSAPCISRAFSASGVLDLRDDEDLESGTRQKKWHTTSPHLGLIKLWFEDFWF